jgi:hypothetical protein
MEYSGGALPGRNGKDQKKRKKGTQKKGSGKNSGEKGIRRRALPGWTESFKEKEN